MDDLNRELTALNLPALKMGIGVHSGPVVVGNIGSKTRKKYGIVGAAVNTTQRIQGQSGVQEVVVSEAVYAMVKSQVTFRRAFKTALKGKASSEQLYAVAPNEGQHITTQWN